MPRVSFNASIAEFAQPSCRRRVDGVAQRQTRESNAQNMRSVNVNRGRGRYRLTSRHSPGMSRPPSL